MKHLAYIIACFVILCNVQLVKAQGDVKIGTQVWTSKNLDVSTFRNGDSIPEAKNQEEWKKAGENEQPAWCYYDNDPNNGKKYGKLYNWYAVNDSRSLAPNGYHIPSTEEWNDFVVFTRGCDGCWGKSIGNRHLSENGWIKSTKSPNKSGFDALPGGFRDKNGRFGWMKEVAYWWSTSEEGDDLAWFEGLDNMANLVPDDGGEMNSYASKHYGFSVRCIKDFCINDFIGMFRIKSPTTKKKITVYETDKRNVDWYNAVQICNKFGKSCRLPTIKELNFLFKESFKKNILKNIGMFWSSTSDSDNFDCDRALYYDFWYPREMSICKDGYADVIVVCDE